MKVPLLLTSTLTVLLCVSMPAQQAAAPAIEPSPLNADQLAIYRDFLMHWQGDSKMMLNVANITEAFAPLDGDREACLRAFPKTRTSVVHRFPPTTFDGLSVHLVDPRLHEKKDPWDSIRKGDSVEDAVNAGFAAGIFTFSEMIYNPTHDRVAFTYAFVCGGLCGNGGTIIYKHSEGKWIQEKNTCGSWVS
jgi:hypothetical protein